MTSGRWAIGLLLISAALLGFELLLMRLLALAYWGHFAGLVISIAMLGIACSGLFLFFYRDRVRRGPARYFAVSSGLFAVAAPVAFLVSQLLPFTPFLLTWSAHEYGLLAARSCLFFLPFFLGGIAIGTPFVAAVLPMARLYFWNMLGSGLPALPLLFAMNFTHPMRLLAGVAALAAAVPLMCARTVLARAGWTVAASVVIAAALLSPFRYSEYKDLPKTLLLPEARLLEERYGWDGVVQTVDSPHTRYLPGLSLNFAGTLPRSELVFTDGGAMTLAFQPDEALANPDFLRMSPEALSVDLTSVSKVLHLYGSTADLLRAKNHGARHIRIVDDSATRVAALRALIGSELAPLLIRADARQHLEHESRGEDVIGVSLLGTHGTATAGAASLDPSFLLTLEGCSRLFARLNPAGHAVFTTWIENPPRSGVRLISLLSDTLRSAAIGNPSSHLLALRSYSTLAIFVGREPFGPEAITALRKFCDANSFDLVWFHGIRPEETNQFNALAEDPYYDAFVALLGGGRQEYIAHSPFALASPTDDRPFFNQYFRWAAVPQWISTMGLSWLPFVEWGYILHVATLVVVTLLGLVLLIVPCFFTRARPKFGTAALFLSLGMAYMFVQIWAILKLAQFVAHPLLASALVLSVMLAASGAGAAILTPNGSVRAAWPFAYLCGALVIAMIIFPILMRFLYAQPTPVRAFVAVLWLALPAFFMGFPYPNALAALSRPADVPWALALNGFGSVLGSLLATLVAVHFGLLMLAIGAVGLYLLVALISRTTLASSST